MLVNLETTNTTITSKINVCCGPQTQNSNSSKVCAVREREISFQIYVLYFMCCIREDAIISGGDAVMDIPQFKHLKNDVVKHFYVG